MIGMAIGHRMHSEWNTASGLEFIPLNVPIALPILAFLNWAQFYRFLDIKKREASHQCPFSQIPNKDSQIVGGLFDLGVRCNCIMNQSPSNGKRRKTPVDGKKTNCRDKHKTNQGTNKDCLMGHIATTLTNYNLSSRMKKQW